MHTNTAECAGCDAKLATAHPTLIAFAHAFRASHPEGHISCSSRSQADQEADFKKGVTKAHWGQSPHDFMPSRALDWFRLTAAAGASFDKWWYEGTLAPAAASEGLTWGGNFTALTDMPHVELADWKGLK